MSWHDTIREVTEESRKKADQQAFELEEEVTKIIPLLPKFANNNLLDMFEETLNQTFADQRLAVQKWKLASAIRRELDERLSK